MVNASLIPEVILKLEGVEAIRPRDAAFSHDSYVRLQFSNTHVSVHALDLRYRVAIGVVMDKHLEGEYILSKDLNYKIYYEASLGTLKAGDSITSLAQCRIDRYKSDAEGNQVPVGPGLETFMRDYLPELREQEVTGNEVPPYVWFRVDYSFKPAAYGAKLVEKSDNYSMFVHLRDDGTLLNCHLIKN
jgi:hypothetical protein